MIELLFITLIFICYYLFTWESKEKKRHASVMHQTDVMLGVADVNQTLPVVHCHKVIDGDTIIIDNNERVRFANIDAYESNSPIHGEIMNYLVPLIQGKDIRIKISGTGKFGRSIGTIYTIDGTNVNKALVAKGYARVYDAYCDKSSDEYIALKRAEEAARVNKLGGWWLLLNAPWEDRHA